MPYDPVDPSYRLTVDDFDPTWPDWHRDRLPDVHATPAGESHHWILNGRTVDGYAPGAVCARCGWRPDPAGSVGVKLC
jgi:hypothetical protein